MRAIRFTTAAIALAAMFAAPLAKADLVFSPTLSYTSTDTKDSNDTPETKSSLTGTAIDLRFGFEMPGGLFVGGLYGMDNYSGKSGDNAVKYTGTGMGPSVGFVMGSFNLIGTYLLSADYTKKIADFEWKYKSGSGMQVDVGWQFGIASKIGFGPQITYRSLSYKKRTYTAAGVATETEKTYTDTEIYPKLQFWFAF